jgi:isoamyl acetate esterase
MFKKLHKLVLFGDSITRRSFDQQFGFGIAPALANDYSCKLDVVVRGFGGYSSEFVKYVLPTILEQDIEENSEIKLMVSVL